MRSLAWARWLPVSLLPLLACSDTPATSVMLALRVDPGLAGVIDHVELHVYRPDESSLRVEHCFPAGSCTPAGAAGSGGSGGAAGRGGAGGSAGALPVASLPELPGTLALYPDSQDDLSTPLLVVLEGKLGSTTKLTRRARMSFVKDKSKVLRLDISAWCLPVDCSKAATGQDDLTCAGGRCIPTTVDNQDGLPDFVDNPTALDPGGFSGASGGGGAAGTAGQGGAGMGGSCPVMPVVGVVATPTSGPSLISESPFTLTVTATGGLPPFTGEVTLSDTLHHTRVVKLPPFSDKVTTDALTVDFCGELQVAVTLTGSSPGCGATNAQAAPLTVAPLVQQVSGACTPAMQCGSSAYPWCSPAGALDALDKIDKALWPKTIKLAASTSKSSALPGFTMRDGVDVEGGYNADFTMPPNANIQAPSTVISQDGASPAGGTVVIWPPGVKAKLGHVTIKSKLSGSGKTPSQLVSVASSAQATLEYVSVMPDDQDFPTSSDVAAIRVVVDDATPAPPQGLLSLHGCTIQAPRALFLPAFSTHRSRSVGVQTAGNLALTLLDARIQSGLIDGFDPAVSQGAPRPLSAAVEHLASGGAKISSVNQNSSSSTELRAAPTPGGFSVGLRAPGAMRDGAPGEITMDTVKIVGGDHSNTPTGTPYASLGVVLGSLESFNLPEDFSPGDPTPEMDPSSYQLKSVTISGQSNISASNSSDYAIGVSAADFVSKIELSGATLSGTTGNTPVNVSKGLWVEGGGSASPTTVVATAANISSGYLASIENVGAYLHNVTAQLTGGVFMGALAAANNGPGTDPLTTYGLILINDRADLPPSTVAGGKFVGGIVSGPIQEVAGLLIDVPGAVNIGVDSTQATPAAALIRGTPVNQLVQSRWLSEIATIPRVVGLFIKRGAVTVSGATCEGGDMLVSSSGMTLPGESIGLLVESPIKPGATTPEVIDHLTLLGSTFRGGGGWYSAGARLATPLTGAQINGNLFDGAGELSVTSIAESYGLRMVWARDSWLTNNILLGGRMPFSMGLSLVAPSDAQGRLDLAFNLFQAGTQSFNGAIYPEMATAALLDLAVPAATGPAFTVHLTDNILWAKDRSEQMFPVRWLALSDSMGGPIAQVMDPPLEQSPFIPQHNLLVDAPPATTQPPAVVWLLDASGKASVIGSPLTNKALGFPEQAGAAPASIKLPVLDNLLSQNGPSSTILTLDQIVTALTANCAALTTTKGAPISTAIQMASTVAENKDLGVDILSTPRPTPPAPPTIGPLQCGP